MSSIRADMRILLIICCLVIIGLPDGSLGARNKSRPEQNQWEPAIKEYEEWDARNSFPKDAVLFLGSSSIRWWKAAELFPEYPVINRGFGGAKISDINFYAKRIVLPYKPKVIVFYCGVNDLFAVNRPPKKVFADYRKFVIFVRKNLPGTKIIFLSIKPGPKLWSGKDLADEFNEMVKEFSAKSRKLFYVDVTTGMLNRAGKPDPRDYQADRVHLTDEADRKWAGLLKPTLQKVYNGGK